MSKMAAHALITALEKGGKKKIARPVLVRVGPSRVQMLDEKGRAYTCSRMEARKMIGEKHRFFTGVYCVDKKGVSIPDGAPPPARPTTPTPKVEPVSLLDADELTDDLVEV